ncbi:alkaline phosphatase PafA [Pseudopedobacter beijingensis]|uniref:Alkaline phosphatase PafA n=1 Tax=Pseudopedobacter beijingensis TaxID=1207056 RepID=A0ABW4ICY5_9SPHI
MNKLKKLKTLRSLLFLFLIVSQSSFAQKKEKTLARPRLVVGIVVDQMRWDYLYRYYDRYQDGGFKRLLNEGFSCENTYITHLPAVTAIGHSTIYTGSVPAIHGITSNNFTDQLTGRKWYCAEDTVEQTVGSKSAAGKMSPRNLLASTVTDELALATNFRSKIVGVSLKDRAAIMPAGHTPTAAFWLDNESDNFITSTYYMKDLPDWVNVFNSKKLGRNLVKDGWHTLYPMETYVQSTPDNVPWEGLFAGEKKPVFPHDIKKYFEINTENIRKTPFGNTLTLEFAKATVEGYDLANGPVTNFLTINCASTDYIGHMYSANSVEAEDGLLRLDKDLSSFFKYLDAKVGKGNYTVFLTADHGGAHNPMFLEEHNIPTGMLGLKKNAMAAVNKMVEERYGLKKIVTGNTGIYLSLNAKQAAEKGVDYEKLKRDVVSLLMKQPGIQFAADMENIGMASIPQLIKEKMINGYNAKRTGEIAFIPEPGWTLGGAKGATHSLWNPFDTHIPLVFMGWGINQGKSVDTYSMCDIAPTIAALLHIQAPNGSIGKAISEVIKK